MRSENRALKIAWRDRVGVPEINTNSIVSLDGFLLAYYHQIWQKGLSDRVRFTREISVCRSSPKTAEVHFWIISSITTQPIFARSPSHNAARRWARKHRPAVARRNGSWNNPPNSIPVRAQSQLMSKPCKRPCFRVRFYLFVGSRTRNVHSCAGRCKWFPSSTRAPTFPAGIRK